VKEGFLSASSEWHVSGLKDKMEEQTAKFLSKEYKKS